MTAYRPEAARLADDVLMFGTYGDAPALRRRWQEHADTLALVAPFGLPADDIVASIDAVTAPMAAECSPAGPRDQLAAS